MNLEIKILKDLVSFPVLGGESNLSILAYIEQLLKVKGIAYTLVPNEAGNKASLHCRLGPAVDGGAILSGHMDVVPVTGQQWHTDPFEMTYKDGKWYGRGTCDMKGFLACCLASIDQIQAAALKKPIYFAFSYDEEIGCLAAPDLIRSINEFYQEKPKFAIIGEPTMMTPVVGQKGICVLETRVNGSAGHSSRIKQEVSAIHEASRIIMWLENKMDQLIDNGRVDSRFKPPHSSIHIGKINGGIAPNVIADEVIFYWDVRTIPMDSIEDILHDFSAFCNELQNKLRKIFPEFTITTNRHHPAVPPLDTQESMEVVSLIKLIANNDQLDAVSYAAEAGQFAEGGFQSVICGPGDIAQAHRADEFIEESQLTKSMQMIHNLIRFLS